MIYLQDIKPLSKIHVDKYIITFGHLDGMYSYCTTEETDDNGEVSTIVIHLYRMTLLIKVDDHYEIDESI